MSNIIKTLKFGDLSGKVDSLLEILKMIKNIESNKVGVDSIIVNRCVDAFIYVMNDIFTNPLD